MVSLVKCCHMMYHVKNYQRCKGEECTEDFDSRKMEQFVLYSNSNLYRESLGISTNNLKNFFS